MQISATLVLRCTALNRYVIDLSFLVSQSAHLSCKSQQLRFYRYLKNGCRSQKSVRKGTKVLGFDQGFEKMTIKALRLFHFLINLIVCMIVLRNTKNRVHFKFFKFSTIHNSKISKFWHILDFWNWLTSALRPRSPRRFARYSNLKTHQNALCQL